VLPLFKGVVCGRCRKGFWGILRVLGFGDGGDGFFSLSGVFRLVGGLLRGVLCYDRICDRFGVVVLGGTSFLRGSAVVAWIGVCCHRFLLLSQAVFDRFSVVNN
jgi:hypothetical protein